MITFSNKVISKIIGFLFVAAILAYGIGYGMIEPLITAPSYFSQIAAHKNQVLIGLSLMLLNSVFVIGIAALFFPILKKYNKNIAFIYLSTRVIEALLLAAGVFLILYLLLLSNQYLMTTPVGKLYFQNLGSLAIKYNELYYQMAMAILSLGSLFFCYLLKQSKLIPSFLAIWGLLGYAVLFLGAALEILGFKGVGLILCIPGGLFEIFFAGWLIVKGLKN